MITYNVGGDQGGDDGPYKWHYVADDEVPPSLQPPCGPVHMHTCRCVTKRTSALPAFHRFSIFKMATEVPDLLRFLSQDAKVSLALAMGKVLELQKAHLTKYAMTSMQIS
jgi:hypothetical protein